MLRRFFLKRTDFDSGGWLKEEAFSIQKESLLCTPINFVAPRKVDFRDMCLKTSDQSQTPHCTGYATAGYIEVQNWRNKHYPEQLDGDAIYKEAKKLDGNPDANGSWIRFAVQGAMNLGLISGKREAVQRGRQDLRFAIHEFGVCIAGFVITNEWNNVSIKGIIPDFGHKAVLKGGHAVLICGYDDDGVYIQNSWSPNWGLHGFALLKWKQFDRQFRMGSVIRPS